MVWFGLNWSLELYEQAIARLARQGQTKSVMIHRLLAQNTMDYAQADSLSNKAYTQDALRSAIQEYRRQKYGK
jgi:SNF2 family DNA or RNA helicase